MSIATDLDITVMETSILRFRLAAESPAAFHLLFDQVHPDGKSVLNSVTWRGKPPRTCKVTNMHSEEDDSGRHPVEIEVTYRSPDYVTYVRETRYEGWDFRQITQRDGIPIGEDGEALSEDAIPYYDTAEVYDDIDFNQLDFGELLGETESQDVVILSFDDWWEGRAKKSGVRISGDITFLAARRSRPEGKVVVSPNPRGVFEQSDARVFNVNAADGHFKSVLPLTYVDLISDFLAGQISLPCISGGGGTFLDLADTLVDASPNAQGLPSRFDVFNDFMPDELLLDVGKRLTALFLVQATVITGTKRGILLKHDNSPVGK